MIAFCVYEHVSAWGFLATSEIRAHKNCHHYYSYDPYNVKQKQSILMQLLYAIETNTHLLLLSVELKALIQRHGHRLLGT